MLEKIADYPVMCGDPEHDPPKMMVLEPGIYRHTCPSCFAMTVFTVPMVEAVAPKLLIENR